MKPSILRRRSRDQKPLELQRQNHWSLAHLEPRRMLAGDAGAEVAAAVDSAPTSTDVSGSEHAESSPKATLQAETAAREIAFVDSEVAVSEQIDAWVRDGVELVIVDSSSDAVMQMDAAIQKRSAISAIHILSHGDSGRLMIGDQLIDAERLKSHAGMLRSWAERLTDDADILIYGCKVAAGSEGERFVQMLARHTGADVAASSDVTGSDRFRGDWDLEVTTGAIEANLLASAKDLNRFTTTLPITVFAAGSTGEEQMQLEIDGTIVQTWNNVAGDAEAGVFQEFTYNGGADATADQVRVIFSNDAYEPSLDLDRNLRVDRVVVNGNTVQSEDPLVFGTGTWLPDDGISPGYRQSEWIHGNGYFQYYDNSELPSSISIYAAGSENTERMELWIDGTLANTWNNIGGDADAREFVRYDYTATSQVSIDQVKIVFSNDLYENDGEIDRNLRVDKVVIDGAVYETEAPDVFSTGTYQDDEISPGYKQAETLHINGYFQYGSALNPGVISLQTSNVNVDEDAGTVSIEVIRSGGSDGEVTVDYETQEGTATDGADFVGQQGTLTFENGQTSQNIVIALSNDNTIESNEAFNVTIDNVTGGATLLVPRTATVTIVDDEVELPSYSNFNSVAGLQLNGDARRTGNALELTTDNLNRAGSAFFTSPIKLDQNASFRSAFSFEITGGGGPNGADGLTFTIQNDPREADAVGANGGRLGYEGIENSVAIEFDTYRNGDLEVNANHVSIISGTIFDSLRTAIPDVDLNDGGRYYVWVDYNGVSDNLSVFLSSTPDKPALALMKATVDLGTIVGDTGYVGFTAGTGGLDNSHRIRNWSLDQQAPALDPPAEQPDTVYSLTLASGLNQPTAIDWLPDGTMLIAEKGGVVKARVGESVSSTPFIDISTMVNGTRDRGLLDIAVHPDFENNPYVYLLFTYDPPEVYNQAAGTLAGPNGNGNRAGRLIRVTADVDNGYHTAVAGSEVVLLGTNSTWDNFNGFANSTFDFNEPPAGELPDGSYLEDFIPSDSESHTIGALAFGTDGNLFVSIGDGASYNRVDVRADRVQDIDSLSGKVLRIDPITGEGLTDNPFFNGDADANRSKVYQLGLRNPFRMSVDPETGQLYVGDVGWTKWEEINAAGPGANFGWPFYEGGSGVSEVNTRYRDTPEGQAFFSQSIDVEASIYGLNHQVDGINAIVMGDVYRGDFYGEVFDGDIFFNDLGQGIVRHASIDANGNVTDVQTFVTGANVVVAISQGPDGILHYVDLDDGRIGRWELI
ncbi:protein containing Legume lectin, beta chain [Rhodopirellula sallentina SM41]|uniref:Protein containing Legume lectin, beta chain n=2 Tax=Rhodopirellula TaxID=265488 RepID=M5U7A9_9BACT|nr:protein containing Legume lectin, beta chain [Rhodopirellula sallentina SM41]